MSSRKFIREHLRHEAKVKRVKTSKWVRTQFDRLQTKRYGAKKRKANQAKGTHKRGTWRVRVAGALEE
jgi:hypothetical protein